MAILKSAVDKRKKYLINRLCTCGYNTNIHSMLKLSLAELERMYIDMLCSQAPKK